MENIPGRHGRANIKMLQPFSCQFYHTLPVMHKQLVFFPTRFILNVYMLEKCYVFLNLIITNRCMLNNQFQNFLDISIHKTAEVLTKNLLLIQCFESNILRGSIASNILKSKLLHCVPQRQSLNPYLTCSEIEGDYFHALIVYLMLCYPQRCEYFLTTHFFSSYREKLLGIFISFLVLIR